MTRVPLGLFAMVAWLLAACATGPTCTSTSECGDFEACVAEQCKAVECLSGADCAIEQFCDPDRFTCEDGCASSDDCLVGDRCDLEEQVCVARQCFSTQVDCELGERCNPRTGRCRLDPAPHCARCTSSRQCDDGLCFPSPFGGGVCGVSCSPEAFEPCPAGLQCSAVVDELGNPVGNYCIGQC